MAQAQILMQNVGGNEEETDDQDGDREEEESLPEHRFVQRDSKITLYIGDHIFRRRYIRNDLAKFTCTGCEKISKQEGKEARIRSNASAIAQVTTDGYLLLKADEDHQCWTSGFNVMIREAIAEMYQRVEEDPTQKIPRIYQQVRAKFTENLDLDSRCAFLQEFPTYRAIQSGLYKRKYQFVPRDPAAMKDFDADLAWCTLISGENIIKGDTIFANEKRVLLFTTNDLLEVLARAKEILGDGTFKITPLLWGQVFVISAQVTPSVFVPVAVFLLASRLTTPGRRTLPLEVSSGLS